MLIDRTQRKWAWISFVIFLVATGTYAVYAATSPNGPHGGSVMGLIYGIIGTAFMVFAGLLAARKRVPHWRLGSGQFWLRGHLWLGTLSMPLILYHAGFGWGGLVENILWVVFGLVYVSGFFGLAVQQVLPRILTTRIPLETFGAQIPYQCRRMQFLADRLVSETCGKLDIRQEDVFGTFKKLSDFAGSAKKEELANWPDHVPNNLRGLMLDLATYSKQQGWINQENNFPKMLSDIYADLAPEAPTKPAAKAGGAKKASPLEQMKAKKAAAGGAEADAGKKPSPLEQMKAKAAAKKTAAGGEAGGEKKLSPLEQMKAKAAAKKAAAEGGGEEEKKLSPIEQMRAKAAAKKAAAEKPEGGEEEKKLSPIEQMRAKAAAKKAAVEKPEGGEEEKKLSPIEQMRAKAAAKKAAAENPEGNGEKIAEEAKQEPAASESGEDGPIVVPCPECEYELKLPDRSLLGRKGRCPLCSFKFVLELPEAPKPVPAPAGAAAKGGPSPLKQAMLQDAGGKTGGKVSPLEAARQQAGGGTATAEKPLSPIEKMRAAKAKTAAAVAAPAGKPAKKKKATLKVPKKKPKTYTGPIPRAGELKEFYLRQIRPFLGVDGKTTPQLAVDAQSKRLFSQMRSDLPGELHDTLNQLEDYVDERRQFKLQTSVHRWLHWWLFLHIPLSMGMYILMIAHIIMSLIVNPQLIWG